MREGIVVEVSATDRVRLEAVLADRNSPQKHVWRARIVLLTADGHGTNEIMRRTAKSKTAVWRWQERFMQAGVDGLLCDKTGPPRMPPLAAALAERVVRLTTTSDPPAEATHWTAGAMAKVVGISVSSVQRIWRAHGLQIRSSPPSCATSSASTSIRRRTRWCCRSTRSRRSRHSIAPSPGCR